MLTGDLPRPEYPDSLAERAEVRWLTDARASLGYARAALAQRGDVLTAIANSSRGIVEASHSRLAGRSTWALNEKGIADAAGIAGLAELLLSATTPTELGAAIDHAAHVIDT